VSYTEEFRNMIRQNNWRVLDTETTGLNWPAEAVNIAVIDWTGEELVNTLVLPVKPIPPGATAIHGITDQMVAGAPLWRDVRPQVIEALSGHDLVIYNANYDLQILSWTDTLQGIKEHSPWQLSGAWCAMEWYAEYFGEWDDYHGNYRWQKLTTAIRQQRLQVKDAHGAIGDCRMTRELILKVIADLAAKEVQASTQQIASNHAGE